MVSRIFSQETELVYLFLCTVNVNNNIRRPTEFMKLSDEFDKHCENSGFVVSELAVGYRAIFIARTHFSNRYPSARKFYL